MEVSGRSEADELANLPDRPVGIAQKEFGLLETVVYEELGESVAGLGVETPRELRARHVNGSGDFIDGEGRAKVGLYEFLRAHNRVVVLFAAGLIEVRNAMFQQLQIVTGPDFSVRGYQKQHERAVEHLLIIGFESGCFGFHTIEKLHQAIIEEKDEILPARNLVFGAAAKAHPGLNFTAAR